MHEEDQYQLIAKTLQGLARLCREKSDLLDHAMVDDSHDRMETFWLTHRLALVVSRGYGFVAVAIRTTRRTSEPISTNLSTYSYEQQAAFVFEECPTEEATLEAIYNIHRVRAYLHTRLGKPTEWRKCKPIPATRQKVREALECELALVHLGGTGD